MINFDVSNDDKITIRKIAERAMESGLVSPEYGRLGVEMNITAVHANGCPLRLAALLAADDLNFAHDITGIHRHLNRETGKLDPLFLPRFAVLIASFAEHRRLTYFRDRKAQKR